MKTKSILLIISIIISMVNADDINCKDSAKYYEDNFATASNPESFNLAWARCEKSLGNDELSVSAYERVLFQNPNNTEAIFALIPLYRKIGMDRDAQTLLLEIDEDKMTQSQRNMLFEIKKNQPIGIDIDIKASMDYGYDTNLNYNIFTTDSILPLASPVGSSFYSVDIEAKSVYRFKNDSGLSLQSNLLLYKKDNKEGNYFDISSAKIDIGLGYNSSTLSLYIPILYQRVNYLDRDLYEQFGTSPKLTMSIDDEVLLNLGLQYIIREYINSVDKSANDTLLNSSIGFYRFFGDSFIYGQFDYGLNRADSSTPSLFTEYKFFNVFAGINYQIKAYDINLGLDYQYSYRDYNDQLSSIDTSKRVDEFQQAHIFIKKELNTNWTLKLDYSYLNNSSNYALIDYDKNLMSVGLEYRY
ncbi:MAG: surface lipoprotein assembly modifier [Sulfurovum sp.]